MTRFATHSTAVEKLQRQTGRFRDPSVTERGAELVDVNDFMIDVVRGSGADIDLAEAITDGYIERTMDGASVISVTVRDPMNTLLKSGIFGDGTFFRFDVQSPYRKVSPNKPQFRAIDVNVDGLWFRLAQVSKAGQNLTLTFEDRIVAWLKVHDTPRKSSRAKMTRAQFIKMLVDEIKQDGGINFNSPELKIKQPIDQKKLKRPTDDVKRHNRDAGLLKSTDINVKGKHATATQLENAEAILDTGSAMAANRKCMVASMMVSIQESTLSTNATNGTHVGLFQQNSASGSVWRKAGGASRDAVKDAKAFFEVCIQKDKDNPSLTLPELCEAVQVSGQGSLYGQWTTEAKKIVSEFSGGSGPFDASVTATRSFYKSYEFHRGPPDGPHSENTWDCSKRLADEVNWRRFVVGNTFFYVMDADLIKAKPIMEISEDDEGIESIDFDVDSGKPTAEATVECRADRWFARPGEVIKVKDLGIANGRWLVWTIHRDLFSTHATITLRMPEAAKPEPAPELATVSQGTDASGIPTGGRITAKGARDAIVKAAQLAASYGPKKYSYGQVRPMPKSLFGKGRIVTDCSGFVTLCYKAAGVPDPNGFGYNGSGNTQSLMAHGKKIHSDKLAPGDLVFYRSPEHVGVFIGGGQVVEFGGDPGPKTINVNYRGDLIGYFTYDLTRKDESVIQNSFLPDTPSGGPTPLP